MKNRSPSSIFAAIILIALLLLPCSLYLAGCANPNAANALDSVLNGALSYASGNDVGAALDGIQAASYLLRSLQSTPSAANPGAIAAAVDSAGAAPIGATVANAVVALTAAGHTPSDANEMVAEQLDSAAAQILIPSTAAN